MIIIERIEDEIAVLEISKCNGEIEHRNLPVAWLPYGVREGDVLRKTEHGYSVDREATKVRRAEVLAKLRALSE